MNEIFLGVAGIVGIVLGFLIGSSVANWKARKMARFEAESRKKEQAAKEEEAKATQAEHEKDIKSREEKLAQKEQEIQSVKDALAEKERENADLENEIRRSRQWFEGRFNEMARELTQTWEELELPKRVHEIEKPLPEEAGNKIRDLAEQIQEWTDAFSLGYAEIFFQLGLWYFADDNFKDAADAFQKATAKGMGFEAWLALGDAYWELDKQIKARAAYSNCLRGKDMPDHIFVRYAQAAIGQRKFKEGLDALDHVIQKPTNGVEVYKLAALAYGKVKDYQGAVKVCELGLKHHPKDVGLLSEMIIPLGEMGQKEKARDVYSKGREIDAEFAPLIFSMGVVNLHHDDLKEATAQFKEALKLEPKYPEALYCLGVIENRSGKYKKALGYFKRAIKIKPDYAEAYYQMRDSYENLKDFDNALAMLKEATRLNPEYK